MHCIFLLSVLDIDECAEGRHKCVRGVQLCVNTLGGYNCVDQRRVCGHGFRYNSTTLHCQGIIYLNFYTHTHIHTHTHTHTHVWLCTKVCQCLAFVIRNLFKKGKFLGMMCEVWPPNVPILLHCKFCSEQVVQCKKYIH